MYLQIENEEAQKQHREGWNERQSRSYIILFFMEYFFVPLLSGCPEVIVFVLPLPDFLFDVTCLSLTPSCLRGLWLYVCVALHFMSCCDFSRSPEVWSLSARRRRDAARSPRMPTARRSSPSALVRDGAGTDRRGDVSVEGGSVLVVEGERQID